MQKVRLSINKSFYVCSRTSSWKYTQKNKIKNTIDKINYIFFYTKNKENNDKQNLKSIILPNCILIYKIKNRLTFNFILLKAKRGPIKITIMETKEKKEHGAEIKLSDIAPLELWKKLGLEQLPLESFPLQEPTSFADDESKKAYEAFRNDLTNEKSVPNDLTIISSDKGGIFLWSLLKEEKKRCPKPKLSSKKLLFKDVLFERICERTKEKKCRLSSDFSKKDFEDIILYLERKRLVYTSDDVIRTTQHLTKLLHQTYNGAWVVL